MARCSRESGQSAVETALTLPMMVFFVLGVVQLGMMHQAQLMTEYAAYRAVRAGIVNHADCEIMRDAAFISLLPTLPPPLIGAASSRVDTLPRAAALFLQYRIPGNKRYPLVGLDRVVLEIMNPTKSRLNTLFNSYGSHLDQKEIDYDDIRNEDVIRANLLTVRITYYYQMRIPFADRLIHGWFMGIERLGHLRGIQFENQRVYGVSEQNFLETAGATRGNVFGKLAALAKIQKVYAVPLVATYSMRMQSNLFKSGMAGCAIN